MKLPLSPPVAPMLAKAVKGVPDPRRSPGLLYEPKWDGFRCIVFRDGDEVELASRSERPLTRYFPEVVAAVKSRSCRSAAWSTARSSSPRRRRARLRGAAAAHPPGRVPGRPAGRRDAGVVRRLRPARAGRRVAAGDRRSASGGRGSSRRSRTAQRRCTVTPATDDVGRARQWFDTFEGAGLDGVVAKPLDGPYQPDKRAMLKIKHERTADCVVAGFRWHKTGPVVGLAAARALRRRRAAAARRRRARPSRWRAGPSWSTSWRRGARTTLDGHPWRDWARRAGAARGRPDAGRAVALEREEGPVLGAAAARPRRRGALRPHGGHPVPAHHPVRPLAGRPRPGAPARTSSSRPVSFDLATVLAGRRLIGCGP